MTVKRDRELDRKRKPTHPGVILNTYIEHQNLTQRNLAEKMDIPRQRLSGIVNKRRQITADTAHRLARVLDTTPEFWMNLQTKWNLWEEQQKKGKEFAQLETA